MIPDSKFPITWLTKRSQIFPDHHISKAALVMALGGSDVPLMGAACERRVDAAFRIAECELFERLYTHPRFVRATARRSVDTTIWPSDGNVRTISRGTLIRMLSTRTDGTGCAFGNSFESAAQRAILEVCERHVSTRVWYMQEKLIRVWGGRRKGKITAATYTLMEPSLPYALTRIYDPTGNVLVAGAALSPEFQVSKEHSFAEAVMLYDSVILGHQPQYVRPSAKEHFRSLRGPESARRADYLATMVVRAARLEPPRLSVRKIVRKLFGISIQPTVVILHSSRENWVVLAKIPGALTPTSLRPSRSSNSAVVADPFS